MGSLRKHSLEFTKILRKRKFLAFMYFFNNKYLNYFGSAMVKRDPVAVSWSSLAFYEETLFNFTNKINPNSILGRGALYYPRNLAFFNKHVLSTSLPYGFKFPRTKCKPDFFKNVKSASVFSKIFFMRDYNYNFWKGVPFSYLGALNAPTGILAGGCYYTVSRGNLLLGGNLRARPALNIRALNLKIGALKTLISKILVSILAFSLRKRAQKPFKTGRSSILKRSNIKLIFFFKLQAALLRSAWVYNSVLANVSFLEERRAGLNISFYGFSSYRHFIEQLLKFNFSRSRARYRYMSTRDRNFQVKRGLLWGLKHGNYINCMAFKFLRRLRYLLTKRGGRLRAFFFLNNLQSHFRPSRARRKMRLKLHRRRSPSPTARKPRKKAKKVPVLTPILKAAQRLKVYFFLRKFTKARKTIFIPGILPKKKRVRATARFFNLLIKRKKAGRPLNETLIWAIQEAAYNNNSTAKQAQLNFNKQVGLNKINIVPRKTFKFSKQRKKKVKRPKNPRVKTLRFKSGQDSVRDCDFKSEKKWKALRPTALLRYSKRRRIKRYRKTWLNGDILKLVAKKTLY